MKQPELMRVRLDQRGFSLVELVIVIVVLGIMAAVAIPKFADFTDSSKVTATRQELATLRQAIAGNAQVTAGGTLVDRGFLGDVGFVPGALLDLARKPDSVAVYNQLSRLGWNGPYIDSSGGHYATDAWGVAYVYQPAQRRILSVGGGDTLEVTF